MPRIRSAMREGWKSSSASSFSPVPISLIGLPVTARIESAAPPRPSPSTRVSTMPVRPTRSSNERARLTASWPVSASATSSTSCGFAACFTLAASFIISSSSVVRPAVSSITTSKPPRRPASSARRAICGGVWPSTIGSVSTPTCRPRMASCSIAAGRRVSSEAISTLRLPWSVRRRAIFAVVVVLPEPCRPTIMTATGAGAFRSIGSAFEPSVSISWSCTSLTTIWPGVTDLITAMPTACFFTCSTNERTTSSATSASSSARRTSRIAASTSASVSAPRRVRRSRIPPSRSDRLSNMRSPRPHRPFTKHFRARGRIALSGGGRRPQGLVGELALRSLARAGGN